MCVCVNECVHVYVSREGRGHGDVSSRCRRCIDGQRIEQQKRVTFHILGTRTWVCFEGSGNVLGTRRSDGSSKPGMSCGDDLAEASMRDRG